MNLQSILSKFLPSSISPKSIENFANSIETIGKVIAALLAVFYVVGLIIFGLYHSKLHIRSIELLQVRYLFVGFYYFFFIFLHIAVPVWWIKRVWPKIMYVVILLISVILVNPVYNSYIDFLLGNKLLGSSFFEFNSDYLSVLNSNIILLVISFIFAPTLIFFCTKLTKTAKSANPSFILIVFVLVALYYNYQIFTSNIFPYIPDGMGGGQSPIVHIVFADNVPDDVTSNFNLAGRVSGSVGGYYYAELVYVDKDSVFLKEPFWYAEDIYEIQRKDILMLEYKENNPAALGLPYLLP